MAKPCKPIPTLSEKDKKRFFSYVKINGPDDCHEWQGYTTPKGYGLIGLGKKLFLTHRVVYFLEFNRQPDELCVCHRCDNPSCCNPFHLFLGTIGDNNADKMEKGRNVFKVGSSHASSKLTEGDISKIRDLYAVSGVTQQQIADQFGVTKFCISDIIMYKTWKHTARPGELEIVESRRAKGNLRAGEDQRSSILKSQDVLRIREIFSAGGTTYADLGKIFGVNRGAIYNIVKRKRWKHI